MYGKNFKLNFDVMTFNTQLHYLPMNKENIFIVSYWYFVNIFSVESFQIGHGCHE